jgi:hypothetical protein
MVRQWRSTVKGLLPGLHAHTLKALAAISVAMALAAHCHSGRVAALMPGPAQVASRRRRVERFLANDAVDPAAVMNELGRSVLSPWSGRPLFLILDETPKGQHLRCMKLSAGYRKRALPLAYQVYTTRRRGLDKLVLSLLRRVAKQLPPGTEVTLLADRGLCWPSLIRFCQRQGWHYVLRMQGATRVRWRDDNDGREVECPARERCPRPGAKPWFGTGVRVFKKAGWIDDVNVVATWERRCREPWLLVTDRPASYARCRGYAKRTWCEQMHRDEKRQGFHWGDSHVEDPRHAARLLLAMALAMLLAISVGTAVLKNGLRHAIDGRRRRLLSIFQIGLRWIHECLANCRTLPDGLYLYPQ